MPKKHNENSNEIVKSINETVNALLDALPEDRREFANRINERLRKQLRSRIAALREMLIEFENALDSIHKPAFIFDPSSPDIMGELIAKTLVVQERHSLKGLERFYGSGVYALYYLGDFDAYHPLCRTETPLYVGKVDPEKRGAGTIEEQGTRLFNRLIMDHAKSIKQANNLEIDDFECRYLVVASAWQNTAESFLIDRYKPIWNKEVGICYGIGKHGDKALTRSNRRSPWDTLHPGRRWASTKDNVSNLMTADEIKEKIRQHFDQNPPQEED